MRFIFILIFAVKILFALDSIAIVKPTGLKLRADAKLESEVIKVAKVGDFFSYSDIDEEWIVLDDIFYAKKKYFSLTNKDIKIVEALREAKIQSHPLDVSSFFLGYAKKGKQLEVLAEMDFEWYLLSNGAFIRKDDVQEYKEEMIIDTSVEDKKESLMVINTDDSNNANDLNSTNDTDNTKEEVKNVYIATYTEKIEDKNLAFILEYTASNYDTINNEDLKLFIKVVRILSLENIKDFDLESFNSEFSTRSISKKKIIEYMDDINNLIQNDITYKGGVYEN